MYVPHDDLVTTALAGDTAAFAELVERNRAWVEAVVERMVGEEAEDLVQEALLARTSVSRSSVIRRALARGCAESP